MKRMRAASHCSWVFGLIGTLAGALCPEAVAGPRAAVSPVEFLGCAAIRNSNKGRVCMLRPDAKLTVWVDQHTCRDLAVVEQDQELGVGAYNNVQGGCQLLTINDKQQATSTVKVIERRSGRELWRMAIDRSKPKLLEWQRRISSRAGSDLEDVVDDLRRLLAQNLDVEDHLDVSYALALALQRLGRFYDASQELGLVMHKAMKAGYPSIASNAAYRRAHSLLRLGMHAEARVALNAMAAFVVPDDSRCMTDLDWAETLLARAEERFEAAAEHGARAVSAMERVHDQAYQRAAIPTLAELLLHLNETQEAKWLLDAVEPLLDGASDCQRADLLTNVAFVGILMPDVQSVARQELRVGRNTIRGLFTRALRSRLQCRNEAALGHLYKGLATVDLAEGRYADIQGWLTKARMVSGLAAVDEIELWQIEAQAALEQGKGDDAIRLYKELDQRSRQSPEHFRRRFECQAAVGKLEALRLVGREDPAVVASVRACVVKQGNVMSPADVQRFTQRAQAAGLAPN